MKKVLVISIFALFITVGLQPVFATNIIIGNDLKQPFNGTFGNNPIERGYYKGMYVQQTSEGGYILVGATDPDDNPGVDTDVLLIKTDSAGNMEWKKTYGGYYGETGFCVQETSDAGYIITGETYSTNVGDVWLIKTDSTGNKEWDKKFGGPSYDTSFSVRQTTDGGYIITGETDTYDSDGDVWLIKTDSAGNMEWDKVFSSDGQDWGYCVQQTTDGGYIITGYTEYFGWGYRDVWLIKTDSFGNHVWDNTFGGSLIDNGFCVQQTSDGGYIITGLTHSFGVGESQDVWLIKTNSTGFMEWDNTFGGKGVDWGECVRQTDDGGYIITGRTSSFGAGSNDVWLIKTDSSGNKTWDKTFGDYKSELGYRVQQTTDGGFIIIGDKDGNMWLIKTDNAGIMEWDKIFNTKNKGTVYIDGWLIESDKYGELNIANEGPDDEKNSRGDELDQSQTETNGYGNRVSSWTWLAQGFTPTLNYLTKVKLRLFRHGNPPITERFTVSIRDDLYNERELTKISKYAIDIPQDRWVEFDFRDIKVNPGQEYYIVCRTNRYDYNNDDCYCWFYDINDPYKNGETWLGVFGIHWELLDYPPERPKVDSCFITYGANKQSRNIILTNSILMGLQERFPLLQKLLIS